jgi:hypothetical protein
MFDVSNVQFRSETKGIVLKEALNYFYHFALPHHEWAESILAWFIGVLWRGVSGAALSIVVVSASIVILVIVRSILVGVCMKLQELAFKMSKSYETKCNRLTMITLSFIRVASTRGGPLVSSAVSSRFRHDDLSVRWFMKQMQPINTNKWTSTRVTTDRITFAPWPKTRDISLELLVKKEYRQ